MFKISFTVAILSVAFLGACSKKISEDTLPAYFSGFAQQIQAAEATDVDMVKIAMQALCEVAPKVDISEDDLTQTVEFKDCKKNGIETNGSIRIQLTEKDKTTIKREVSGQLNFKVLDPELILAKNCSKLVKKDDTASCSISTTDELVDGHAKSTGSICGLEQEAFGKIISENTCKEK